MIRANPQDERAWFLMSMAVDDPNQKRDSLKRVLQINPGNADARTQLDRLDAPQAPTTPAQPPTPAVRDVTPPAELPAGPSTTPRTHQTAAPFYDQDDTGPAEPAAPNVWKSSLARFRGAEQAPPADSDDRSRFPWETGYTADGSDNEGAETGAPPEVTSARGTGSLHFPWESPEVSGDQPDASPEPGTPPGAEFLPWQTSDILSGKTPARPDLPNDEFDWGDGDEDAFVADWHDDAPDSSGDSDYLWPTPPPATTDDAPDLMPWEVSTSDDDDQGGLSALRASASEDDIPAWDFEPEADEADWQIGESTGELRPRQPEPFVWDDGGGDAPAPNVSEVDLGPSDESRPADYIITGELPPLPTAPSDDNDPFGDSDTADWYNLAPVEDPFADPASAPAADSDWSGLRAKDDEHAAPDWMSDSDDLPGWGDTSYSARLRDPFAEIDEPEPFPALPSAPPPGIDLDALGLDDDEAVFDDDEPDGSADEDDDKPRGLARFLPFLRRKKEDTDDDLPELSPDGEDDQDTPLVASRLASVAARDTAAAVEVDEQIAAEAEERRKERERQRRREARSRSLRRILILLIIIIPLLACTGSLVALRFGLIDASMLPLSDLPAPISDAAIAAGLIPAPTIDPNAPTPTPTTAPTQTATPTATATLVPNPTLPPTVTPSVPTPASPTASAETDDIDGDQGGTALAGLIDPALLGDYELAFLLDNQLRILPLGDTRLDTPSAGDDTRPAFGEFSFEVVDADWHTGTQRWVFAATITGGDGTPTTALFTVDATASENPVQISSGERPDSAPVWSPDGSQIAFVAETNGFQHIWIVNADGSDPRQLTDGLHEDLAPAFLPDGSQIVFESNRNGTFDLFAINTATGDTIDSPAAQLTFNANADERSPAVSPVSNMVAYVGTSTGEPNIYLLDRTAPSAVPQPLTTGRNSNEHPAWSPDGSLLAYTSTRDGNYELYVSSADGEAVLRLTNTGLDSETMPLWIQIDD